MPSIDKFFWMSLLCSLFLFNLTQLWAAEKVAKRTDYAQAVGAIIVNCEKKQCLQRSRSSHLKRSPAIELQVQIELVCVSCNRIDCGDGTWFHRAGQSNATRQESLCPHCCRKQFPQFYSNYERPPKIGVDGALRRFSRLFRPG